MSRSHRRERIRLQLSTRQPDRSSEEFRTVYGWLAAEIDCRRPVDWATRLPTALDLGLELYRRFMEEFTAVYLTEGGPGEGWVRHQVRCRLGFATPELVEAVLNRIRNRRLRVLNCLRRRFQPSLFGPRTFNPVGVRGYLAGVARNESRKATLSPLRTGDWDLNQFGGSGVTEEGEGLGRYARQLSVFWSEANGFPRSQRLEGLLSLGLGFATGSPLLEEQCRAWLARTLPAWERRRERLARNISRLLARQDEVRLHVRLAGPQEKALLEEDLLALEERLGLAREALARHLRRLRPRPKEVQEMLRGVLNQRVGTLRFQRLQREVVLLRRRLARSREQILKHAEEMPGEISALLRDLDEHLEQGPSSPREHGLSVAEREQRRRQADHWGARGVQLLGRIRAQLTSFAGASTPGSLAEDVRCWLADAEDLYEFGLLTRCGVMGGLGRRHGWRLDWLLRCSAVAHPGSQEESTVTLSGRNHE